jgi:hypothetical protein
MDSGAPPPASSRDMSAEAELRVADAHVEVRLVLPAGRLTIVADEVRVEAVDDYNIDDLEAFATALGQVVEDQARGLGGRTSAHFLGASDRTGLQVRQPGGGSLRVEAILDDQGVSVTAWVEATPVVLADFADQVAKALSLLCGG